MYKKTYQRYYIRPMGNTHYDEFGIVYPQKVSLNLFSLIKDAGGRDIKWTERVYWTNQEKVISFFAKFSSIAFLQCRLLDYPVEVISLWSEFKHLVAVGQIDRIIIKERQSLKSDKKKADFLSMLADIADGVDNYAYSG